MAWQPVLTLPLDVDSGVAPARARAITEALCRRIVPLLLRRAGRVEPLASGGLYLDQGHLVLLTCRHLFESGAALGDLAVPLGDSGRLLRLDGARARPVEHPVHDLLAIDIRAPAARAALQQHWRPVELPPDAPAGVPAGAYYAVAGYPYAQTRRIDGTVYARPVVFFARRLPADAATCVAYARTARRVDGLHVFAPELDGVSGATVWSVTEGCDGYECLLQPAGVQCAFKHDAYVRGEPFSAAHEVLARVTAR
jgi:hypothetical protein